MYSHSFDYGDGHAWMKSTTDTVLNHPQVHNSIVPPGLMEACCWWSQCVSISRSLLVTQCEKEALSRTAYFAYPAPDFAFVFSCHHTAPSLLQIREFVDFRDKLQRSFQYKSASTERLLLDLTLETNCHASTEQMLSYIEVDPSKGQPCVRFFPYLFVTECGVEFVLMVWRLHVSFCVSADTCDCDGSGFSCYGELLQHKLCQHYITVVVCCNDSVAQLLWLQREKSVIMTSLLWCVAMTVLHNCCGCRESGQWLWPHCCGVLQWR